MALEPDDFHYNPMGETEDITRYVVGGYHPLHLGVIIGESREETMSISGVVPRYRIMHKLGFGSYATVWLAEKTDDSTFVAVKVTTADSASTKEAEILEAILKVQTPESHILTLLDHFTFHGPNGKHSVLVTDVVVPIVGLPSQRPPLWRKVAALGLAKAVAHLHANDIVHGDLHLGNVGVAFPQLANQDPDDIMQDLSPHNLVIVLPSSSTNQTSSLPPYVIAPCALGSYYDQVAPSDLPQTKLIDFGSAHKAGKPPLSFQCAVEACAPEVVFARIVEKNDNPFMEPPTDIWALGTAIYGIMADSSPFSGIGMPGILPPMVVMAGSLPRPWNEWWNGLSEPPTLSPDCADAWWTSRRDTLRASCKDDADLEALIVLLRKILVLEPTERPTIEQVIEDHWFLQPDIATIST